MANAHRNIVAGDTLLLTRSDSTSQKQLAHINGLIESSIQLAYHSLRNKCKGFEINIETDFDRSIGEMAIFLQDLHRALINLIDNACYAVFIKTKAIAVFSR